MFSRTKFGFLALCALGLVFGVAHSVSVLDRIKQVVEEKVREHSVNGAIVAASFTEPETGDQHEVCFVVGESDTTLTCDSLLQVSSLTMSMTGLLALEGAERGAVRLDEQVRRYYPQYNPYQEFSGNDGASMTDLLNHRTGVAGHAGIWQGPYGTRYGLSREELVKAIQFLNYDVPPRYKFLFNHIMFTAGGEALAAAWNMLDGKDWSWADRLEQEIFTAYGMEDTYAEMNRVPEEDVSRFADTYSSNSNSEIIDRLDYDVVGPAKGAVSTGADMLKWIQNFKQEIFWKGKILQDIRKGYAYREGFLFPTIVGSQNSYWPKPLNNGAYSYGMNVEHKNGVMIHHHSGYAQGMTVEFMCNVANNFSMFIAANQDQSPMPFQAAKAVADTQVGIASKPEAQKPAAAESPEYPKKCAKVSSPGSYNATYRNPAYGTLVVEELSGELVVSFKNSPGGLDRATLCLEEDNLFVLRIQNFVFRLQFKNIDGKGVIDSILFDYTSLNVDGSSIVVFTRMCSPSEECASTSEKWVDADFPSFPHGAYYYKPLRSPSSATCSSPRSDVWIIALACLSGVLLIVLIVLLFWEKMPCGVDKSRILAQRSIGMVGTKILDEDDSYLVPEDMAYHRIG